MGVNVYVHWVDNIIEYLKICFAYMLNILIGYSEDLSQRNVISLPDHTRVVLYQLA